MIHLVALSLLLASPPEMKDAPRDPAPSARIAPENEPGTPLTIQGTLYAPDGTTPVPGAIVYAYQTDATGVYRPDHDRGEPPRLRGWARTDAKGRFEFRTIRPAPYPGREVAAHVHFHVWGGGYPRQWTEDLLFRGDPLLTAEKLSRSAALGKFANVCDPQQCAFNIRLKEASKLPVSDDVALVSAARQGDRLAFGRLYGRYAAVVHAIALAHVPGSEANDLVQDVFLRALRRIEGLRDASAFGGWLAGIARNRAREHHRRTPRGDPLPEATAKETQADAVDAAEALAAIRALPEAYRETLLMRLVEGLTGPEIAERSGMTEGSVRVNLHRGMKLLREKLGRMP